MLFVLYCYQMKLLKYSVNILVPTKEFLRNQIQKN